MTDDQLHREVARMARELADKDREIHQLKMERDEARRMLCEEWAKQDGLPLDWQGRRGAEGMAEFVKWDCFDLVPNDIEAHEVRGDVAGPEGAD